MLEPGEHAEDVLAGAVAIALRRASIFGRAPVAADIELALSLFGYLGRADGTAAPSELVEFRRERFAGAAHDYWRRRALADEIPGGDPPAQSRGSRRATSKREPGLLA